MTSKLATADKTAKDAENNYNKLSEEFKAYKDQ